MSIIIENSHIHLDIVGGIAGDMFISAMLDTFEPLQADVLLAISKVIPDSIGKALLTSGLNLGISGLRFSLQLNGEKGESAEQTHEHIHHHTHGDSEHHHAHEHSHEHNHSYKTTYRYLCELLSSSTLDKDVIGVAIELLTIIGVAEAKIHNKTLDEVHFHELADWDSLMDVVAAAVILNDLSACTWSTSKLPLGSGLVNTQHGLIPVPAPATAEILIGFDFVDDNIMGERITPTGAAILRYLRNNDLMINQPQGQLLNTGYGLGTKVFPGMPNILRALQFSKNVDDNAGSSQQGTVVVISFDIDDMTGEELALSLELIRKEVGVVDITVQSARGKKNRAVESVRILASSENYQTIIESCFIQTSTIGLRYRFETRQHLSRTHQEYQGQTCKSVIRPNGEITQKIEHDNLTSLSTLQQRRSLKYQVESSSLGLTHDDD